MKPRVVVVSLASDFGCQIQMTNVEDDLLDIVGNVDISYWQLASSGHMPEDYDVAIVEGAVTTQEHVELLRRVRDTTDAVIAIGACAITGGISSLASFGDLEERYRQVYGEGDTTPGRIKPRPVSAVIDVDYIVPGCPIDTDEYLYVLGRALQGLASRPPKEPMCAICKTKENICFFDRGQICLGIVTRTGCGALCPSLGRPCSGCRGFAADVNFEAARKVFAEHGWDMDAVLAEYRLFNATEEVAS